MKIGIVTEILNNNYGGILQNYALQQILIKLGHTPKTIDCLPGKGKIIYILSICKNLLLFKFRNLYIYKKPVRSQMLWPFIKNKINLTLPCFSYKWKNLRPYQFEAIIVGSDQVWRPLYNKYVIYDMFLKFTKAKPIKRIAYAASFGVSNWEYSESQTLAIRNLIKLFKGVSVREASAVNLCLNNLGCNVIHVLDPTMLLSKAHYNKICEAIPLVNDDYLVAYILDEPNKYKSIINDVAKKNHLKIKLFSADRNCTLSVEEWISMFRDAKYIVTDSFHGTVFSIIYNKDFISLGNSERGNDRFTSLLSLFDLTHRFINDSNPLLTNSIDWDKVNIKLAELKIFSIQFIQNNLK